MSEAGDDAAIVYIPMDRRQALARGVELPDRAHGAALFADISGFTSLADALARVLGPRRGAEELSHQLNLVYDSLIAEVDRYRGSVIGFSGDAIACWFDGDEGLHAVACALAMQQEMDQLRAIPIPGSDVVVLSLKVAVATGSVRRFLVGNPDVQLIDVIAGATLDELAETEHQAAKGEVVLAPSLGACLEAQVDVAERRRDEATGAIYVVVRGLRCAVEPAPWPPLAPATLSEQQVRPWLLPPVYERLRSGYGEFLAELRPAAALFLRFSGIDYDRDPAAGTRLGWFIQSVQSILVRYGGFLVQVTVGDKGSYLYAAFGAPVAHDDDVARAAAAAFELQSLSRELSGADSFQIGLTVGRMRTGAYGGRTRRTYGVLGDEVNLAARLMQHASPGRILASDGFRRAAGAFSWESVPALWLKGKSEPEPAARLVAARERRASGWHEQRYTLPMVGREKELALIEQKLDQALAGQGQIIGITAEAGMGKSRLVAEIIRRASAQQYGVYVGDCQSYGTHNSYLVWQSIWQDFFGLESDSSLDDQLRRLETELAALDPSLVHRLPLLSVALNLPIPDNDLTQALDPKLRKASLEELLVACLRARANVNPVLLVLEDCHWLDPLSEDLLEAIGRVVAGLPVLIVATYRPPEVERLHAPRVTKLPHCTLVPLTDLTAPDAERLIALKLSALAPGGATPPASLVERITARAQGNPFYIEELLNYLHDQGWDPGQPQAWDRLDLPSSLHRLILSRIDRLAESQKTTIKVASVVGRVFRLSWLWGVHPELGSQVAVVADLDQLGRLDLTPLDQPEPEQTYLFKHIVTREVAYESLLFATRAVLHGQLATFIERTYAEALEQYVDLLAHHFDQSNLDGKKREYLHKAGDAARAAYANAAAIDYYRRLLGLVPEVEQAEILLKLGQVLELVGEWQEAGESFQKGMRLAEQVADVPVQVACQRAVGWLRRKQGDYREAVTWLTRARSDFERLGDFAATSQVMADIGEVSRHLGGFGEAKARYDEALRLSDSVEERASRLRARAYALKGAGTLAAQQGDLVTARSLYEESLAIRRDLGDMPGAAMLLHNLGIVAYYLSDYTAARILDEEALAVFREIGDRFAVGQALNNLAGIASATGDYALARRFLAESVEIQRQLGDKGGIAIALNSLADVLQDEGDHDATRPLLVESLTINVEIDDQSAIAYLLDSFASVASATRQPERALRLTGAAATAHDRIGSQLSAGERARFDRLQAPARAMLGDSLATARWEEGRAFSLQEAICYALEAETELPASGK
jgi:predicted ATPase/class 3 adenylate cyclase